MVCVSTKNNYVNFIFLVALPDLANLQQMRRYPVYYWILLLLAHILSMLSIITRLR